MLAPRSPPDIAREHFTGDQVTLVSEQIPEQIKLTDRQIKEAIAPDRAG
jgi:hypothetical protein